EAAQRLRRLVRALEPLQRRRDVVEERRLVRELERFLELVVGGLVVARLVGGGAGFVRRARVLVAAGVGRGRRGQHTEGYREEREGWPHTHGRPIVLRSAEEV